MSANLADLRKLSYKLAEGKTEKTALHTRISYYSGLKTLGTSGSGEGVGPKIRELENSIEST